MGKKRALITGITGQDGSYLAEFLLEKGYEVIGMVRRTSTVNFSRISHIQDKITLVSGDLLDQSSLIYILEKYQPDEVYNLAAQSFVPTSFEQPVFTGEVTALGVTRLLEAIRIVNPKIKFYQASSSVDGKTPVLVRRNGKVELVPIEDLMPPDTPPGEITVPLEGVEVLTVNDNYEVVFAPASHISRHFKDHIYTLRFSTGGELKVTGDHSVIVFDDEGRLVEKRVEELREGDCLISYAGSQFPKQASAGIPLGVKEVEVTPQLMRFLGFYLARGQCEPDPDGHLRRVNFTFNVNGNGHIRELEELARTLFPSLTIHEIPVPESDSVVLTVESEAVASLCAQFGTTAYARRIPPWVWELEPGLIHHFLAGYLGETWQKEGTDPWLASELVYLMRNAGLECQISKRQSPAHATPQGVMIPPAVRYDIRVNSGKSGHPAGGRQSATGCLPSAIFRRAFERAGCSEIALKPLISKDEAKRLAEEYGVELPPHLKALLNSTLGVVRITSIGREEGEFWVYDISVPEGQRFWGGDVPVLLHNSEMFGKVKEVPQNENTPFHPRSPYGVAKVYAHWITVNYRESYGIFACSGILFNHECVTADTPVIIRMNGVVDVVPIGDILRPRENGASKQTFDVSDMGLEVWDGDRFVKVTTLTATRHNPEKEDKGVTLVVARRGAFAATSDHVVIMEEGEKPVGELKEGDRVSLVDLPEPPGLTSVTPEEALLLGMFVADGSAYESGGHIRARFTNKDPELRELFSTLWHKITLGFTTEGLSSSGFTGERDVPYLSLNGAPEYVAWLYKHCYTRDRLKKIPARILNADVEIWREFLRGYNLCNGLKGGYGNYEFKNFKTNSPALALGLWWLARKAMGQNLTLNVEQRNGHFYYSLNLRSPNPAGGKGQHLVKEPNEVKKLIPLRYDGWLFDLATESGTFHAGVGQCHIHNSPRRGLEFVTRKVTYNAAKIKLGLAKELRLGNLDARRDWGFAGDYVKAMWLMLQQPEPDDYVVGTGETHSVRELCELAFGYLGLDWKKYVVQDPALFRPADVDLLVADATKARTKLGWKPTVTFEELIKMMVDADLELVKKQMKEGKVL